MESTANTKVKQPLLNIGQHTENILLSTGKWSKIISIILLALSVIYFLSLMIDVFSSYSRYNSNFYSTSGGNKNVLLRIIFRKLPELITGAIVLSIYLYMFALYNKFARRIKLALSNKDQRELLVAVKSMSVLFLVQATLICVSVTLMLLLMFVI
ncbi:hypothetical protein SAMN05216474_1466 [Lishizhenia tianjinensis]|uniref:FtsX-like permease family protein n=1 Tax=Lishizhenia tianjinensis TaxID=477690 RepID=A0A1I6ZM35_9FLAO|nr:hypothetical protein [Lishizhenia tianjinensis]SFT63625.1 hypothetical protein SAMN05216474_1466 [Lishizhenia tianjinensis]